MCLVCCGLQCALKLVLSPLMILGVALIAVGIWIKVDPGFWTLQLNLDATQFSSASTVVIIVGVVILLIGFLGCCGAARESKCLLITFLIVMIILLILEIAAVVITWSLINDKHFNENIQEKISKGVKQRNGDKAMDYFIDILQAKLHCCGVRNSNEYIAIPRSCMNDDTGLPYEKGCMDVAIEYLKSKATILGSISIITILLQVAVIVFTICLICGIRQAKEQIF